MHSIVTVGMVTALRREGDVDHLAKTRPLE